MPQFFIVVECWGFPRPLLGPLVCHKDSKKLLRSWLQLITVKGYRLKLAEGKGAYVEAKRDQIWASSCPLSVEAQVQSLPLRCNVWQHLPSIASQGSSLEPWCPGLLLGISYIDRQVPSCSSLQHPQRSDLIQCGPKPRAYRQLYLVEILQGLGGCFPGAKPRIHSWRWECAGFKQPRPPSFPFPAWFQQCWYLINVYLPNRLHESKVCNCFHSA